MAGRVRKSSIALPTFCANSALLSLIKPIIISRSFAFSLRYLVGGIGKIQRRPFYCQQSLLGRSGDLQHRLRDHDCNRRPNNVSQIWRGGRERPKPHLQKDLALYCLFLVRSPILWHQPPPPLCRLSTQRANAKLEYMTGMYVCNRCMQKENMTSNVVHHFLVGALLSRKELYFGQSQDLMSYVLSICRQEMGGIHTVHHNCHHLHPQRRGHISSVKVISSPQSMTPINSWNECLPLLEWIWKENMNVALPSLLYPYQPLHSCT